MFTVTLPRTHRTFLCVRLPHTHVGYAHTRLPRLPYHRSRLVVGYTFYTTVTVRLRYHTTALHTYAYGLPTPVPHAFLHLCGCYTFCTVRIPAVALHLTYTHALVTYIAFYRFWFAFGYYTFTAFVTVVADYVLRLYWLHFVRLLPPLRTRAPHVLQFPLRIPPAYPFTPTVADFRIPHTFTVAACDFAAVTLLRAHCRALPVLRVSGLRRTTVRGCPPRSALYCRSCGSCAGCYTFCRWLVPGSTLVGYAFWLLPTRARGIPHSTGLRLRYTAFLPATFPVTVTALRLVYTATPFTLPLPHAAFRTLVYAARSRFTFYAHTLPATTTPRCGYRHTRCLRFTTYRTVGLRCVHGLRGCGYAVCRVWLRSLVWLLHLQYVVQFWLFTVTLPRLRLPGSARGSPRVYCLVGSVTRSGYWLPVRTHAHGSRGSVTTMPPVPAPATRLPFWLFLAFCRLVLHYVYTLRLHAVTVRSAIWFGCRLRSQFTGYIRLRFTFAVTRGSVTALFTDLCRFCVRSATYTAAVAVTRARITHIPALHTATTPHGLVWLFTVAARLRLRTLFGHFTHIYYLPFTRLRLHTRSVTPFTLRLRCGSVLGYCLTLRMRSCLRYTTAVYCCTVVGFYYVGWFCTVLRFAVLILRTGYGSGCTVLPLVRTRYHYCTLVYHCGYLTTTHTRLCRIYYLHGCALRFWFTGCGYVCRTCIYTVTTHAHVCLLRLLHTRGYCTGYLATPVLVHTVYAAGPAWITAILRLLVTRLRLPSYVAVLVWLPHTLRSAGLPCPLPLHLRYWLRTHILPPLRYAGLRVLRWLQLHLRVYLVYLLDHTARLPLFTVSSDCSSLHTYHVTGYLYTFCTTHFGSSLLVTTATPHTTRFRCTQLVGSHG